MKRVIIGIVILIIIALIIIFMTKGNKEVSNEPVKHTVVEKLYEDNMENTSTEVIKITKNDDIESVDDKVLLYLIFGQLKKDKKISSNISKEDYKEAALKIMDEEYIPQEFEYIYEGYKYTLKENITRKKAKTDKNYVTKIFGYSGNEKLEVDIMAGYIKDNKVYDLNDKEIGTYSEEDINTILDKGTMQIYNYEKINDNYKLVSVEAKAT